MPNDMGSMADATFTAVNLAQLPAPDVVETLDFATMLDAAIAQFRIEKPDFVPRPSDPVTKLLRVFVTFAQIMRQRVNDAAHAVMPAYAIGADLDNIAALFGIARFEITPADPILGIPAVMESDADLRRRMILGPEGFSVAGPEGAYIFHALSADPDVLDASATSPAPGEVLVSVLSRTGNGTASQELQDIVAAHVSDESRRPLTDFVTVDSAEIINFGIDAIITTFSGPDADVVLAASRARLDRYIEESHRLGRDITRSAILAALHSEGVQNVALISPAADIIISRTQAPHCTGIKLTHAGTGE
jgi:phage-related baseplate assembly protein